MIKKRNYSLRSKERTYLGHLERVTKKQGSALITALFIMTLIAIVATAITTRLYTDIYRTQRMEQSDRLYLASQAVTFWAMDRIMDKSQKLISFGSLGKVLEYPEKLQTIYPNVKISGVLYDLQARFNLNNLKKTSYQAMFYGLLEQKTPNLEAQNRKLLLDATINWVNGSVSEGTVQHNEWIDRYLKQTPIYYPGYQPMQNVSEFRLVYGVNAEIYQALSPFLTALPEETALNLNTASKELIRTLGNGLNDSDAQELLELRGIKGFSDLTKINPFLTKHNISANEITLESNYYLCVATTTTPNLTLTTYVVIKREQNKAHQFITRVLSESLNTI